MPSISLQIRNGSSNWLIGRVMQPQLAPYGTNAWAYRNLPCETIVIGPGSIDQAHGAREWVEIAELEKIGQIYAKWWGLNLA